MNIERAIISIAPQAEFIIREGIIVWLSNDIPQPSDTKISAEIIRLQAEYDSLAYARSRKQEYDKLNQWEMQFDDNRDGTTTWVDSINEIKARFPK